MLAVSACVLFSGPVAAQSWNLYGSGGSFFVPITYEPHPGGGPQQALVSLTLNGYSQPNNFILDTGSLGLVADPNYYTPGNDKVLSPYATITYSTSGANPVGKLYLTNVQINGANGQSVTARVPILGSTNYGFHQMGVGFDRGGIMIGQNSTSPTSSANNSYNMNPFLSLVSGPGVGTMKTGYIIGATGFSNLGLGPGILLGLNNQNTSGYAIQQLATGGQQSWYGVGGVAYPVQWASQSGSVSITTGGQTYNLGSMSQLPDSGISYMIVTAPTGDTVPVGSGHCSDSGSSQSNCLQPGSTVQVFLPGQTQPAYSFIVGDGSNPSMPFGVQVTKGDGFTNLGRTFFENLDYFYDPINGLVGYRATGAAGTDSLIIPMLALQGTLALPNGFLSSFPTFLMAGNLAIQQSGSGIFNGPITGPGGLTLLGGNVTLGGTNDYAGGTTVNGGLLTVANTGSILGDVTVNNGGGFINDGTIGGNGLLTINAGGSFINNGTVDTPLQWQMNAGRFANNGSFNGSLANTGMATNTGTLTGSVINASGAFSNTGTITGSVANMGLFANNGVIGGSFTNMGLLSGTGSIGGNLINTGVLAPGNSIGTLSVAGNYAQTGGSYQAEVNASRQSDRLNVTGTATIGAGSTVFVLPETGIYAYRTTYTLLNAAGGVTGNYASVASALPFLQPSLSYDANNVYLSLQIGGFAQGATT
ncbi:MAG: hypothetical protein JWQ58_3199, partial [Reyranella sp.]|nr:hypothetical protein [Reyranella sp.]